MFPSQSSDLSAAEASLPGKTLIPIAGQAGFPAGSAKSLAAQFMCGQALSSKLVNSGDRHF